MMGFVAVFMACFLGVRVCMILFNYTTKEVVKRGPAQATLVQPAGWAGVRADLRAVCCAPICWRYSYDYGMPLPTPLQQAPGDNR